MEDSSQFSLLDPLILCAHAIPQRHMEEERAGPVSKPDPHQAGKRRPESGDEEHVFAAQSG
eukprot:9444694-Heterocapsa_arctica.AAC.1